MRDVFPLLPAFLLEINLIDSNFTFSARSIAQLGQTNTKLVFPSQHDHWKNFSSESRLDGGSHGQGQSVIRIQERLVLFAMVLKCEYYSRHSALEKRESEHLTEILNTWLPRHRENRELEVPFSRQGKHREFAKNIKNMFLHKGIYHQHRENLELKEKIWACNLKQEKLTFATS